MTSCAGTAAMPEIATAEELSAALGSPGLVSLQLRLAAKIHLVLDTTLVIPAGHTVEMTSEETCTLTAASLLVEGVLKLENVNVLSRCTKNQHCIVVTGQGARVDCINCSFTCESAGSDQSPYPKRFASCLLSTRGAHLTCKNCRMMASPSHARGIVVQNGGSANLSMCMIESCDSSAVWGNGKKSSFKIENCRITRCGGYGSIYMTNGAFGRVVMTSVTHNAHGYGVMCLHNGSMMEIIDSEFSYHLWSGIAARWSGRGLCVRCRVHHNGANGFQVRKSCCSDVVLQDCQDYENHQKKMYAFKHRDLKNTSLSSRGLPSRGVSKIAASKAAKEW